ncbi:hypothetical protein QUF55_00625 [Clostridiaceae bacterium HSG29]|nr:hypothetical protein [Clostridiaceae bacterium HSG29]
MKKIIILIIIIVIIFIMFFMSRSNDINIIGNPDFEASFLEVTSSNFISKIEDTADEMNFPLSVIRSSEDIYIINDIYTIYYSEGFLRMTFKKENDENKVVKMIEILVRTLEPLDSDLNFIMQEVVNSENAEELFSGKYGMYSIANRYEFIIREDNSYEFHIEDARMGH